LAVVALVGDVALGEEGEGGEGGDGGVVRGAGLAPGAVAVLLFRQPDQGAGRGLAGVVGHLDLVLLLLLLRRGTQGGRGGGEDDQGGEEGVAHGVSLWAGQGFLPKGQGGLTSFECGEASPHSKEVTSTTSAGTVASRACRGRCSRNTAGSWRRTP